MSAEHRAATLRKRLHLLAVLLVSALFLLVALVAYLFPFEGLVPAYAVPARGAGEMRFHFLDVGEGDCAIVEFPEGETLVVDSGNGSWRSDLAIARYIRGLGSPKLTLIATHADRDHIGGFPNLIKLFDIGAIYLPVVGSETSAYRRLLSAANGAGCPVGVLSRYDSFVCPSGAYAVCLSPRSAESTDENNASAVLYLSYAGVGALLCGDISSTRERLLASEYAIDKMIFDSGAQTVRLDEVEILKISHHGSSDASDGEWLRLMDLRAAVISCGRGNMYGHPAEKTINALRTTGTECEIYRTDELGTVMITISDGGFTVRTENYA